MCAFEIDLFILYNLMAYMVLVFVCFNRTSSFYIIYNLMDLDDYVFRADPLVCSAINLYQKEEMYSGTQQMMIIPNFPF